MSDCARWHTAVHFAVNDPARDSSIAACSPAYACNPSASSVDRLSLLETWSFHHSFFHSQNMRTCRISSSSSMTSSAHRSARALALAHSTRSARGETSQTDDSLIKKRDLPARIVGSCISSLQLVENQIQDGCCRPAPTSVGFATTRISSTSSSSSASSPWLSHVAHARRSSFVSCTVNSRSFNACTSL
jgi:hypothetical protein